MTSLGELVAAGPTALSTDPADQLTPWVMRWLIAVARSEHTLAAYQRDIRGWFGWCAAHEVDPLLAQKTHVDVWVRWLATTPTRRTGRVPAAASVARQVATVSSLYSYLADEGVVAQVPVRRRVRPHVPNESTTVGLSRDEARALLGRLPLESVRDRALLTVLLVEGLRVAELLTLRVGSIGLDTGHVTATIMGKGGRPRRVVLAAPVVAAVGELLDEYAAAAGCPASELSPDLLLFPAVGGGPMTQRAVARVVTRVARAAGIVSWRSLSPHSLRHACATLMLDAGAALHTVGAHLGHASTRTTERYDRARGSLARTPVHQLAAWLQDQS